VVWGKRRGWKTEEGRDLRQSTRREEKENKGHWFVLIIGKEWVYWAVRTYLTSILVRKAVPWRRGWIIGFLPRRSRFPSQLSPCGVCGGLNGTGTEVTKRTSIFPRQCHSTTAPNSSSSAYHSYRKGKRMKPGKLPKALFLRQFSVVFKWLNLKISILCWVQQHYTNI
jgi:hypothetical protein